MPAAVPKSAFAKRKQNSASSGVIIYSLAGFIVHAPSIFILGAHWFFRLVFSRATIISVWWLNRRRRNITGVNRRTVWGLFELVFL